MDKRRACALLTTLVATFAGPLAAGVFDQLDRLAPPAKLVGGRDFLPPDQAFMLSQDTAADGSLKLHWEIQPGYYLYRDKLTIIAATPDVQLGTPQLPDGEAKEDPEFGAVKVLKHAASVTVPVTARPLATAIIEAEVRYQGCAEDGICYPPIRKRVAFNAPAPSPSAPLLALSVSSSVPQAESDRIASVLADRPFAVTIGLFLGFGVLLSLTPCVLPMVPILSGIIVGQQQPVSARRGFLLSSVYVGAMALTYAGAGVAAGLLGRNLQAAFQAPAVIAAFSALFVLLALSMFDLYALQVPAALQSRLDRVSRAQRAGSYLGAGMMGTLSALIVGPCVAPPLAGALIYIGQSGSAVVGGSALFALGLGMGLPLIALGTSAGGLLPRAGAWMVTIKQAFGVIFLGVALSFLARIVHGQIMLLLWALLLIGTAVFLGALDFHDAARSSWRRLAQGLGVAALVYGAALVIGAAAGGDDPWRPLAPLATRRAAGATADPIFTPVQSLASVDARLAQAQRDGRAVMLDFYADWCVECKHLERETFTAAAVAARLGQLVLLRADVTANDADAQALLAHYQLLGPPALLFFSKGEEARGHRVNGFVEPTAFADHLDRFAAVRP